MLLIKSINELCLLIVFYLLIVLDYNYILIKHYNKSDDNLTS